jgi:hypothetical protein
MEEDALKLSRLVLHLIRFKHWLRSNGLCYDSVLLQRKRHALINELPGLSKQEGLC